MQKWIELAKQVEYVIRDYPNLRLTQGRKVFEIRPTIKWDKGKALEFLLESLGYANCTDVFPVYIGDDKTDEDAFKVLKERGQGFGILVSKNPKDTNALYSLREPSEVMAFLRRLVDSKRLSLRRQFRLIRRLEEIKHCVFYHFVCSESLQNLIKYIGVVDSAVNEEVAGDDLGTRVPAIGSEEKEREMGNDLDYTFFTQSKGHVADGEKGPIG
ncbi:haloacid dehalogenase-like hydrolase superfamily protein [Striga asiatica]|uniref:Trehalose 6-phosphate phosphatase n=1 Tax=Striga asiatica TaxID=4170 RepID=A0A5A7QDC5_STRAF|nr:haloacid dehalogenase-like hydrolase superfamily protein [Striga asiatica]